MRVYISHPIRGKRGSRASKKIMEANNQKAIVFVKKLRERFPDVEFYCPAEHDKLISYIWRKGWITIDQLLEADCHILGQCDLLIVYNHEKYIGRGMRVEIDFAKRKEMKVVFMETADNMILHLLRDYLND